MRSWLSAVDANAFAALRIIKVDNQITTEIRCQHDHFEANEEHTNDVTERRMLVTKRENFLICEVLVTVQSLGLG